MVVALRAMTAAITQAWITRQKTQRTTDAITMGRANCLMAIYRTRPAVLEGLGLSP
jgi:hypothetical protein